MSALKRRCWLFATFWFMIWPLLSILMGTAYALDQVLTREVPFLIAFGGVAAAALYAAPDILVCALLLWLTTTVVFTAFDHRTTRSWRIYLGESVLAFAAMAAGIALRFPSLLQHPLLIAARDIRVYQCYALIFLLIAWACAALGRVARDSRLSLRYAAIAATLVLVAWLAGTPRVPQRAANLREGTFIVALDSVSQTMDLGALRRFTLDHNGAYYEHAVSPGLMTNSTWTSVLMHRPLHQTGVVLTFQSPDWNRSDFQLVTEARRRGYETWSYFADQCTCYVGSLAGFDHDRSSPMGWLQLGTVALKNGSVFAPVVLAALPRLPFARTPRNHAGTYSYHLRAAVGHIFASGSADNPALVIAHVEYLHQNAYPPFADLTPAQRRAVLRAPVHAVADFSADWQYPNVPDDPLGVYAWKLQHLQQVLAEELRDQVLENSRHRVVIFADHGNRSLLDNNNFGSPKYYNVPLVTFGVPARDPELPISTAAISELLGFRDPAEPVEPAVEYANFENLGAWKTALAGATWLRDGRIEFRPEVGHQYVAALRSFRPYRTPSGDASALAGKASVPAGGSALARGSHPRPQLMLTRHSDRP